MEYAFWNTIHDGGIDAINGTVPGDLVLTVGIEYLCAYLPTKHISLHIVLKGCTLFEFTPFDGDIKHTDLQQIAAAGLEVLSAENENDHIRVSCVYGILITAYMSEETRTIEGQVISQSDLLNAADWYWSDWKREHEKGGGV